MWILSQDGESDLQRAFPIKCKGLPTTMCQEENRMKSQIKKLPVDKLRTPDSIRSNLNLTQVVNRDACNNNVASKRAMTSSSHFIQLLGEPLIWRRASLQWQVWGYFFFHAEQSAVKSTGRLQTPAKLIISNKMLTKRPVQLKGSVHFFRYCHSYRCFQVWGSMTVDIESQSSFIFYINLLCSICF